MAKIGPLPPIEVPWEMKSVSTATTTLEWLDDRRLRLAIRHEVIAGVTPAMIVWWFNNMAGTMRVGERDVPRYRVWHPLDHHSITYVRPAANGANFGRGARVRIREFLDRNPRYEVDRVAEVDFLDETGMSMNVSSAGLRLAEMRYAFKAVEGGTLYENSFIAGVKPALLRHLNKAILARLFPEEQGRAWLKHNVEEVGNLQFFLPDLYRELAGKA
jgi:hypothetical protein